ncbi:MAG: cyclopropane-fatty-acyl-phospholipid synthase family protein [Rhodospirillales bacterium]|jgi:cyclopropane-fatty-acyl-phospholipid synthase|nr:SAM-dependent methyltransferase [Rhodospirillaceae bacterium]MDP6426829.1 cyclopropane-fatty-acyl-phospholipid synthase family protein [Rhodospirillales bacterium]MDP6643417.1 cyclopropane-fatty-acyl-phospholipid synthase family protein [Rhodospirillales bacterium]MDP6841835.1 cyclopropane-fatty-acyl-phospholipid synthase family protein [Rhodospirillales bacterium]
MFLVGLLLRQIIQKGTLEIIDAGGRLHRFGDGTDPKVTIRAHKRLFPWRLAFSPSMTLGESYMDGSLTVENGGHISDFLALISENVGNAGYPKFNKFFMAVDTLFRRIQQFNPIARAQRNVAHHYDLSGGLYELFLDPDKQYSCAYFETPDTSLATAQEDKKHHIAAKLLLGEGQRVLDIGSGWGGLGLYLARRFQARVTGITLSEEQYKISNQRAAEENLSRNAEFQLRDYRTLEGEFDRIVSVGMFEHVGVNHYRAFFQKLKDLLAADGVALLHTIGRKGRPVSTDRWVRKYLFPGGCIPALSEITPAIEKAGLLVTDVEVLGPHYAETLRAWQKNFQANRNQALEIYDERFCRMWEYYLASSEIAFRHLDMTVFQIQLALRQDAVPMSRNYIALTESALKNPKADSSRAA